jgi:hypothetical protein
MMYMGLGDERAALEEAKAQPQLQQPDRCRSILAKLSCTTLAWVHSSFGNVDGAIDILEEVLPAPSLLSVPMLEIDPIWDPLRDHPRFQALLEKYADDVEP